MRATHCWVDVCLDRVLFSILDLHITIIVLIFGKQACMHKLKFFKPENILIFSNKMNVSKLLLDFQIS